MASVIGVHGISQQQQGRNQLLADWQPSMADGVERALRGRQVPPPELDIAYYGDLFLPTTSDAIAGLKGIDPTSMDQDASDFFEAVEKELVDEDPPEVTVKAFKRLPGPGARLAAWLDHKFGAAAPALFFGDLNQVRRYQAEGELAEIIHARLERLLAVGARVLIGHSLGSIVAYEYVTMKSDHSVQTLVTLGSPLALQSIQANLRTLDADGTPESPGIQRWVNVLDPGDPVTCAGGLSSTWSIVSDARVDNEKKPHEAVRYLGKQVTGEAVVDTLGI